MRISQTWFLSVRYFIKIGLFFYTKQTKVNGLENIPKKGAVLFAINHPNGLLDPLVVTTHNPRINFFLVRAAAFKKSFIKKILESLNLMPIYRIRDGIQQLSNNEEIFNKCYKILERKDTLVIFPEGTHNRKRTARPLSKGFTRIVSGALEKFPDLDIAVIPVGLTYQNASIFPSKVCVNYGSPINTRNIFDANTKAKSINILKKEVSNQLEKLSVHITDDENYNNVLSKLNKAQVDFTEVDIVNKMIQENSFPKEKKKAINFVKPLYYLIVLNSIIPMLIWKKISKKIDEIEFVDTFRFAINLFVFPIFYLLQTCFVGFFYNAKTAFIYLIFSLLLVFIYSKFSPTNTEIN
jgi:1-acyl-sn-glycerol-3-phosphate acyltransferase